MKALAMVVVALAGTTGIAPAPNIAAPETVIPVCIEQPAGAGWAAITRAKGLAAKMFVTAGITIVWKPMDKCPAGALKVTLLNTSSPADHPKSYAYALPFEGTHIVIFWDRVKSVPEECAIPYLLGHVLVHEITHILQGFPHHSETGVMKATFRMADINTMQVHPLPFTAEDLELIHSGLVVRRARLAEQGIVTPAAATVEAAVTK
jgi:hypothetical protein